MSEERRTTCRDLDELGDEDCCQPCHEATATGHERLSLVELDDGRIIRNSGVPRRLRRPPGRGASDDGRTDGRGGSLPVTLLACCLRFAVR